MAESSWSESNLPTPQDRTAAEATVERLKTLDREFTEAEQHEWFGAGATLSWADYAATRASYEVQLTPAGRSDDNPHVVTVEANSAQDAAYTAAEKHSAATGLVFEDVYPTRKTYSHPEWHAAPAAEDQGRAR